MKSVVKKLLQTLFGFDTYLFLFSLFTIYTLRWNKNERDFLHFIKIIPDGGAILDIGANIGIMTVHLSKNFKKSSVYSFEPIPANIKALRRIIRFFNLKNITVFEHALGNEKGTIEMVLPVVDSVKMQGLSHVVHDSIQDFNEGQKFKVEVVKLDDIEAFRKNGFRLNAIKIDVENFEFYVLDGGRNLIEKHRPVIYTELWENENRKKCFDLVKEYNYKIKVVDRGNLVDYNDRKHKTQNFFFIPELIES